MTKQILKKENIRNAAEQLILQKGINATSVNDICAAANASKGAFFHHFKSKDCLIQESILRFSQNIIDEFNTSGISTIEDPVVRLRYYFDFVETLFLSGKYDAGCLIGISAQEIAFKNIRFQQIIQQAFMPTLDRVNKLVSDVAQFKQIEINAESISRFWLASFQGAVLLARGTGDRTIIQNSITNFKQYLFLLLKIS